MEAPEELLYTAQDEWVRITGPSAELGTGPEAVIGITDFAQDQLGDIVFVQLPAVDAAFERGAAFGVVESVKTVADLYMPLGGTVIEVNGALAEEPEIVNRSPYEEGWLIRVRLADADDRTDLMSAAEYLRARPGGPA